VVEIDVKIPIKITRGERVPNKYKCYKWHVSMYFLKEKYACEIYVPTEEEAIKRAQYKFQAVFDDGANYDY